MTPPLLLPRRAVLAGAGAAALAGPVPLRAAAVPQVLARLEPSIHFWLPSEREQGSYIVTWAGPPPGFDPRRADAAQLAAYGLPPRPAGGGGALASWEAEAATWRFAEPDWQDRSASRSAQQRTDNPRLRDYRRAPTRVPGENWGGAYVRASGEARLGGVAARWRVPESAPPRNGTTSDYRCSHWIGLDGCDPNSRSLPQCGTLRAFGQGAQDERGLWWQWWLAGGSHQAGNLVAFDVRGEDPGRWQGIGAGDMVEARISLPDPADRRRVRFWFRVDPAPRFREPPIFLAFDVRLQPTPNVSRAFTLGVEGRVAEWVVERPMRPDKVMRLTRGKPDEWLYELPVFQSVTFEDCRTWLEDGTPGPDLRRARSLRLTDWSIRGNPGRTVARVVPPYPEPMEASRVKIAYTGPL
jgi:hypothetical protein